MLDPVGAHRRAGLLRAPAQCHYRALHLPQRRQRLLARCPEPGAAPPVAAPAPTVLREATPVWIAAGALPVGAACCGPDGTHYVVAAQWAAGAYSVLLQRADSGRATPAAAAFLVRPLAPLPPARPVAPPVIRPMTHIRLTGKAAAAAADLFASYAA